MRKFRNREAHHSPVSPPGVQNSLKVLHPGPAMQMEDDEARLHLFLFSKLCDYSNVPHGDLLSESGVVNAVGSPLTISIVKCFKNKFRGSVPTVYIAVSLVESGQCWRC